MVTDTESANDADADATVRVVADELDLAFADEGDASTLRLDDGDGTFELRSSSPSFWRAELRDEHGEATALDGSDATLETRRRSTDEGTELELRWTDEPLAFATESGTATTALRARIPNGDPTAYWTATLEISGVDASLQRFSLPAVDDVGRVGGDRTSDELILPSGWGLCAENPYERPADATLEEARYPSAVCPMQFLALSNGDGGLYLAAHDPEGRPKDVSAIPSANDGERALEARIDHHPPGVSEVTRTFELPYEVATGVVSGDWYDVARRYRRWVTAEARWTQRGPLAERADVPDWLLERSLWWLLTPRSRPVAEDVELLERLLEAFPVRTGVHWYSWHEIPFDVDYPDYVPAREGWADAVAALEARDVRVMPYVNARIADPNSETWRERGLETAAARTASARLRPSDRARQYEEYGGQRMVAMCPERERWRETIRDVVDYVREESDASALYLDQLGAYAPPLCLAADHEHAPGGGTYGVDGYRRLLEGLRADDRERTDAGDTAPLAVTTENNAEPYMDLCPGALMWNSARSDLVPLFSAVYGDRCLTFGRQFFECDLEDAAAFRSKLAQCFAFGGQPGWISYYVAEGLLEDGNERARTYLRRTAEVVEEVGRTIALADRLRDPVIEGVPARELEWELYRHGRWSVELEEVLAACWRPPACADGDEDGVVLAVTNWSRHERDPTVTVVLPDGVLSVGAAGETAGETALEATRLAGLGEASLVAREPGEVTLEVTLPACSSAVFDLP